MDIRPQQRPPTPRAAGMSPFLLALALLGHCAAAQAQQDFDYIVQPGDNPWNITTRYLKHINYWPRIQDYNQILQPTRIPPGTRLRMPFAWMRAEAVSARVLDVLGTVEHDSGGRTSSLSPGMTLSAGALIRTGHDGSVTLQLPDGSRSLIEANSELQIHTLHRLQASDGQLVGIELKHGRIDNSVQSVRHSGGRYTIETPAAVAAVRGTEFRVAALADGMLAETVSGEVSLRNQRGETRLGSATGAYAAAGKAPGQAVRLLPAPSVKAVPDVIDRLPFRLPIEAVAGAVQYRTQISAQQNFTALASDVVADEAAVLGSAALADGRYRMRVRAIDSRGLEGLSAEREIVVDARPEPPFPSQPPAGGFAVEDKVAFRWARVPDARAYHFQLATDISFAAPVVAHEALDGTELVVDDGLPAGDYFWRIAVSTAAEGRGPWSDPQPFRRPPAGPSATAAEVDGDTLRLHWRAGGEGDRYQIQLSRGAGFDSPEHEFDTTTPEIALHQPEAGTWHVRIRIQEPGSPPGPWGQPQQIDVPHSRWQALFLLLPVILAL